MIEQLYIISRGFEITDLINSNNFVGMLKGPVDLDEFSVDISVSISACSCGWEQEKTKTKE